MNPIITYENLRSFAYSSDVICKKPIRGIAINFFGLGGMAMYSEDPDEAVYFAERGIVYLVPYNNPWAWMNRQAAGYTDELVDVLIRHYQLPENIPVVSTGGSMGGQSAIVYCALARRTPAGCVANCPVCDLPYHFTERPDLPRTLYSAFYNEEGDIMTVMEDFSPLHLADRLPKIPYTIFHCEEDEAVNKQKHSDRLIERIGERLDVVYHAVPGRGHCDLTDEMRALYREAICSVVNRASMK